MFMKTYTVKKADLAEKKKWFVVDAQDKVLGRLATKVAAVLQGKTNTRYTPYQDMGDYVVVINAEKVKVTGTKETTKVYFHYSGYPGGGKYQQLGDVRKQHPERIIENAVKHMLPHNSLGRAMYRKLKVYAGDQHPHTAQVPVTLGV
jgi:large subunit ribosomal protein L13